MKLSKDEIVNESISDEKSEQLAYSVSVIPVQRVNASDSTIEKVVKEKLALKGFKVLELYIQRSMNGIFPDVMLVLSLYKESR